MTTTEATWESLQEEIERPPLTPTQVAWRRFRRHKMAMVGIGLLVAIILYVTVGALFYSEADANRTDLSITLSPPSRDHPLGTDGTG
ncbi:MAG: hypothetical protein KAS19_12010, partial [Anaerolineales bacterium]|nr:hypothetical protein [Anaerolineales bacterium]